MYIASKKLSASFKSSKKSIYLAVGAMCLSGLGSSLALAATDTWNSSTNEDWFGSGVWTPAQPGKNDTALFGTSVIPPLVFTGSNNQTTTATVNLSTGTSLGAIVDNLGSVTAAPNTLGVALSLYGPTAAPVTLNMYGQTYQSVPNVIISNYAGTNVKALTLNSSLSLVLVNTQNTILTSAGTGSATGQSVEIDGNISDGPNGPSALNIFGSGTTSLDGGMVELFGTNTFSGGITVGNPQSTQGAVLNINADQVTADPVTGSITVIASNTGANVASNVVTINEQGQLLLNSNGTAIGVGSGSGGTLYFMNSNQTLVLNGIGVNKNISGDIRTNGSNKVQIYDILANVYFGSAAATDLTSGYILISPTSAGGKVIKFGGPVTGPGSLQKQGSGNLEFSNPNNNLTGATQIGNGGIVVDPGSSIGSGDLLMFQTSTNFTIMQFDNAAQTIGNLTSQYTDTKNEGNPLAVDDQYVYLYGPNASATGTPGSGTALTLNQTLSTQFGYSSAKGLNTLTSAISGPGSLELSPSSTGILTLNGPNSYTGGTTIAGGTLNVANGNGIFTPAGSSAPISAGSAVGSGNVTIMNGGKLISGNNAVLLGQTMTSGTIGDVGTLVALNIQSGGIVSPGGDNLVGSLYVNGSLSASSGSVFNFDLIGSTKASPDLLSVSGAVTLDSTVDFNVKGSKLAFGTYPILTYGSLTNGTASLPTILSTPNPTTRSYSLNAVGGTLDLVVADTGTDRFYSVGGTNPATDGGGAWGTGNTNFFAQTGTVTSLQVPYDNASTADVIIGSNGGAGGTIALVSSVSLSGANGPLVFTPATSPYTIANTGSNAFTLTLSGGIVSSNTSIISAPIVLSGSQTFTTGAGTTLTLSGGISQNGVSSLTTGDVGTIILGGTGTYTGGTSITQGTLQVTTSSLPSVGTATVAAGASLVFSQGTSGSFGGLISGPGTVTINNTGTAATTLSNTNNNYTGATIVAGGVLSVDNVAELGTGDSGITLSGGTLRAAAPINFPLSTAHANNVQLTLTAGTSSTIDTGVNNVTLGPIVQGSGNLTKAGSGTLTFANIHSTNVIGELSILGGALVFNESGNPSFGFSGDPLSTTTYTGDLDIVQPTDVRIFSGNVSGGGNINLYATANGSVLESRLNPANLAVSTTIGNNVNLNVNPFVGESAYSVLVDADTGGTLTFAGVITGTGGIDFTGGKGLVVLSNTNSYSGGTTIDETGTPVTLGVNNALPVAGAVHVTGSGILDLAGLNQTIGALDSNSSNAQIINTGSSLSTLTINGTAGTSAIYNGFLEDGQVASLGLTLASTNTAQVTLTNPNLQVTSLAGNTAIVQTGATGPIAINGGRLDIETNFNTILSQAIAAGLNSVDMTDLYTLGDPSSITVGAQAGNSQLRFDGLVGTLQFANGNVGAVSATTVPLVLQGLGGYAGDPGAISAEQNSTGTATALIINNNVTLTATSGIQIDSVSALTLNGNITGTGGLVLTGGGSLTLAGANTYPGPTTVTASSLTIAKAGAFPAGGTLSNTGSVFVNGNTTIGQITGSGSLTVGAPSHNVNLTLAFAAGVPAGPTSTVGALTINSGSQLNITNNDLVINYQTAGADPVATIRADLTAAYKAKYAGSSLALTSSTAAASSSLFAVGYVDNTTTHKLTVGFTVPGDTDLSGATDFNDLTTVAQFFGQSVAKGNNVSWSTGDVNYDNQVDFNDLTLVAQYFGQSLTKSQASELPASFVAQYNLALAEVQAQGGGTSSVPEPGTVSLLAVGAAGLLARRRRRQA